jgi:hypothetical protein
VLRGDIAAAKWVISNRHSVLQQPEASKLAVFLIAVYYFSKRDKRLCDSDCVAACPAWRHLADNFAYSYT